MNAMVQVANEIVIPPLDLMSAAIRLADEGIPVRAIARSLKVASEEIYETLKEAVLQGTIVALPRDDWPPGQQRHTRHAFVGTPLDNEETMAFICARFFKATTLETSMLVTLLRREHVTRTQLHGCIEHNRASPGTKDETDIKMVDVIICKLRKKLRVHNIEIETVWGLGYLMPAAHRERCVQLLLGA